MSAVRVRHRPPPLVPVVLRPASQPSPEAPLRTSAYDRALACFNTFLGPRENNSRRPTGPPIWRDLCEDLTRRRRAAPRLVMPGLDPGIHQEKSFLIQADGLPGQARQ